jgi:molecular chaperone DnaK
MIFQTENQLKELGDKIPADKKAPIETALEKLKEAHKSQDLAAVDAAMNELNTAFQAASAEMYAQAGAQQAGPQPGADNTQGGNQGDHIQDADFEEVK